MKKTFSCILAVILTFSMMPGWAMGQSATTLIVGMVGTVQGKPVPGVKIAARDASGKVVRVAATDSRGQYALQDLSPGRYQLTLDPINSGFKGETVASAVGAEGLTVNWMVSQVAPALATAAVGASGAGTPDSGNADVIALASVLAGFTVLGLGIGVGARDQDKRNAPAVVTASQ
ncbi:MAG TPA: carboxypeptidase-like regulatory domain-containing protein [Candidatus Binatia bacterium]|jgi:hypothetical protein